MKRKYMAALSILMLSMTVGCTGNMDSAAVQTTTALTVSSAETMMMETQSAQENSMEGNTETSAAPFQMNQTEAVTEKVSESIDMETAKEIALKDAGVSAEAISYSSAKLDWDDGRQVYEVDFFVNEIEYEYEILASSGSILKKKQDKEWKKGSGILVENTTGQSNVTTGETTADQKNMTPVTMEQARQKVAERIPGVDPNSIYMKEDYDHGHLKYEGEVYYDQTKYEFELDAENGMFLDWEEEMK